MSSTKNINKKTSKSTTKEEEEEKAVLADVGFLFEGAEATTLKHYEWPPVLTTTRTSDKEEEEEEDNHQGRFGPIHVALRVVDNDPGAVQSGHYLWPAAPLLCEYLIQNFNNNNNNKAHPPRSLIELGAGTALVSICALQLFQVSLECVVVTDRDPGTLTLAKDNYETTLEELYESAGSDDEQVMEMINSIGSIPIEFENLEWGESSSSERQTTIQTLLEKKVASHMDPPGFDMILGSDLIDCLQAVKPLLQTASTLLQSNSNGDGVFWLAQSFVYDAETETEIDRVCNELNLVRTVVQDTLSSSSSSNDDNNKTQGVKIQKIQQHKSSATCVQM